MSQKFTVLVDLDGTIVDTAPDLMNAHNYVMKKFGYETKTTEEIRNLVGKGAGALIGRSIWGTAKKEHLAIDLLKKIKIFDYFEYVAGSNTFDYCKPDPRHLTSVIEILQGDIKKSLMIGDSETDSAAANSANLPFILLEDGYTDKKVSEIPHDHLVTNFQGIEKIVSKYLNT